ncbi:MAG: hypothetical protein AAFO81_00405 [Pseudomonadota bacterium]
MANADNFLHELDEMAALVLRHVEADEWGEAERILDARDDYIRALAKKLDREALVGLIESDQSLTRKIRELQRVSSEQLREIRQGRVATETYSHNRSVYR